MPDVTFTELYTEEGLMTQAEAEAHIRIRREIIFDDYYEGIRSWEECQRDLDQDIAYYQWLFAGGPSPFTG